MFNRPDAILFSPSQFLYKYGMVISNNVTTPNSSINIGTGQVRDASNSIDISISESLVLDATRIGPNGLANGSLIANKMYQVFIIADSTGKHDTASLLSLDVTSPAPYIPAGYDSLRSIGYAATDSSANFLKMFCSGAGLSGSRSFTYDAPQVTAVTAGDESDYTPVDLSSFVPSLNSNEYCRQVVIKSVFTPDDGGDQLFLQPGSGTGDAVVITAQVSAIDLISYSTLPATFTDSVMTINYKISGSGAVVALSVAGFIF